MSALLQRVCVFDIDGTTLQAGCTSAGPAYAIQQCYENGYSIAINTAESSDQAKANKDNLVAIGVPRSVVDNPATYRSMLSGFDKPGSKVQNMFDIMGYTGAKQGCVLLFDDEKGNVDAVNKAGFPTVRAGTQGCLLSMDEVRRPSRPEPSWFTYGSRMWVRVCHCSLRSSSAPLMFLPVRTATGLEWASNACNVRRAIGEVHLYLPHCV